MGGIIVRRFSARFIDIILYSFLMSFFAKYLDNMSIFTKFLTNAWLKITFIQFFFPAFNQHAACNFPYILILIDYSLLFIVLILEALIILAFFQACFDTTPGNSALGVEVLPQIYKNTFLERFDFYLKREVGVWVSGLGCGFLISSPLFVLWQALRICSGKPAFYDRYDVAVIRFKKFGFVQVILCMMLIVLILALIIAQMMESFSIVELLKKHACYGLYN